MSRILREIKMPPADQAAYDIIEPNLDREQNWYQYELKQCNCVLMLGSDEKPSQDKYTISLVDCENGEMQAYWYEDDQLVAHTVDSATRLRKEFKDRKKIEITKKTDEAGKSQFSQIASVCGYPYRVSTGQHKVHISIDGTQPENFQRAISLICPILTKHRIRVFKFYGLNSTKNSINANGKECVIYMDIRDKASQESNPKFWTTLFDEIESTLQGNYIRRHPTGALGDLLLPNRQYIYCRESNNVAGAYVAAIILRESGFTQREAACIGASNERSTMHFLGWQPEAAIPPKKRPLSQERKILPSDNKVDNSFQATKKSIKHTLCQQIQSNANVLKLFLGTKQNVPANTNVYFVGDLFGISFTTERPTYYFLYFKDIKLDFAKPFQEILNKASEKLAKLCSSLEKEYHVQVNCNQLGSIFPALYYQYFVPLFNKQKVENAAHPGDGAPIKLATLSPDELVTVIDAVVLCALRTPEVQIHFDTPRYIGDLSSKQIHDLLLASSLSDQPSLAPERQKQLQSPVSSPTPLAPFPGSSPSPTTPPRQDITLIAAPTEPTGLQPHVAAEAPLTPSQQKNDIKQQKEQTQEQEQEQTQVKECQKPDRITFSQNPSTLWANTQRGWEIVKNHRYAVGSAAGIALSAGLTHGILAIIDEQTKSDFLNHSVDFLPKELNLEIVIWAGATIAIVAIGILAASVAALRSSGCTIYSPRPLAGQGLGVREYG